MGEGGVSSNYVVSSQGPGMRPDAVKKETCCSAGACSSCLPYRMLTCCLANLDFIWTLGPFLNFAMIRCMAARASLNYDTEADDSVPQILEGRAAA